MRIAFFGGTFDPPHRGHIAIARAAITRLALDQVLVAPVATQPLKGGSGHSSFADRLAMVQLAVAGEPGLTASSIDAPLLGGKPNYTFDTLQRLSHLLAPPDVLFCDFIVAGRPGFSLQQITSAFPKGVENRGERREAAFTRFSLANRSGQSAELFLLPDLDQDISATEIRAALAEGSEQQTVLAPAVAEYIRSHALYRPEASSSFTA